MFLSAKTFGNVTQSTHVAGMLIELLHTATLVHDDVVDDSHMRRGFFSINALWKNKIAVLISLGKFPVACNEFKNKFLKDTPSAQCHLVKGIIF